MPVLGTTVGVVDFSGCKNYDLQIAVVNNYSSNDVYIPHLIRFRL
jgi:hypothetical protein